MRMSTASSDTNPLQLLPLPKAPGCFQHTADSHKHLPGPLCLAFWGGGLMSCHGHSVSSMYHGWCTDSSVQAEACEHRVCQYRILLMVSLCQKKIPRHIWWFSQIVRTPTCTVGHSSATRQTTLFRMRINMAIGWVWLCSDRIYATYPKSSWLKKLMLNTSRDQGSILSRNARQM